MFGRLVWYNVLPFISVICIGYFKFQNVGMNGDRLIPIDYSIQPTKQDGPK